MRGFEIASGACQAHLVELLLNFIHITDKLVESSIDGGAGDAQFVRVLRYRFLTIRSGHIPRTIPQNIRNSHSLLVLIYEILYCFHLPSVQIK